MSNDSPLSPVPEFTSLGEDHRNESSEKKLPDFDEQDYSSHRNVYVGVHVPYSMPKNRKHKKKSKRKHLRIPDGASSGKATPLLEVVEHIEPPKTPVDPCDRVKFILGAEEGTDGNAFTAHSIFTELEELHYDEHGQNLEWKETARWVKYEEDVEEGGEKWSKPHVASLSLHSLFDLRSCILKGTVMLDLVASNLVEISDHVLDHLISSNQLEEEHRDKVHTALLRRHKHHGTKDLEKKRFSRIKNLGLHRNDSGSNIPQTSSDHRSASLQSTNSFLSWFGYHGNSDNGSMSRKGSSDGVEKGPSFTSANRQNSMTPSEREEEHQHYQFDQHFMKKLPVGSEASNVLVGEVGFLTHSIIAFVRLSNPLHLGDLTEVPIPTRFLFILLGPEGNHARYHEVGRAIATMMADEVFHEVAYKARNREDLLAGVDEFLDKVTVLPPGEWDPQIRLEPPAQVPSQADRIVKDHPPAEAPPPSHPVQFSKVPFSGLWSDVKRRYSKYVSDFKDAAWDTSTNKCSIVTLLSTIATIIFIYFANISPAVTFGQVLSEKTNGSLGAVEMIMSVGIGNFIYALTAGQPIVVLGGTGPTLIFEDILFRFCSDNGLPYLEFRLWIGLWTALMLMCLVVFNASIIVRIFTRFTEEIFSSLISFIFIYEAIDKIWKIHVADPYSGYLWYPFWSRKCDCFEFNSIEDKDNLTFSSSVNLGSYWKNNDSFIEACDADPLRVWSGEHCPGSLTPDVFFFSIILFFGTFMLALYLKKFKETPFFPATVRRLISDFAVLISVIIWILVNYFAHVENVPRLEVPNLLEQGLYSSADANTTTRTSFIINPLGNGLPKWAPIAAFIPALLATILLFMDQQITALIINRKDHKLRKGPGYHLDLLIVACLVGVFSILGLPWVVGATVRSIAHVQSLFLYSPCTAPGERPKFLGVKEQRVTLLCMSVLLGVSVLMYQVLELVPLAVLYGLFLYIGVTSLYGVQFVQRILIIFMPDKYKPDEPYVRHIPNRRLHLYTLVQIIMLFVLCIFKVVTQISIIFPIMVLLLVAGRWLVGWIFPAKDLEILDDPIPDKLYCGRNNCTPLKLKGYKSHANEELSEIENGIEIQIEDKQQPPAADGDGPFNITKEMNNCDLWKHMVSNLEKESPSSTKHHEVKTNLISKFNEVHVNGNGASASSPLYKTTEV